MIVVISHDNDVYERVSKGSSYLVNNYICKENFSLPYSYLAVCNYDIQS